MDPHATPDQRTDRIRRLQARQQRSLAAIRRSEAALAHTTELLQAAHVTIAQARMRRSRMTKTIRQLREERGESRSDLAAAVGVTLSELTDWELGRAEPGVARMRLLSEHFGVRDDQINLKPGEPPTLGERLADAF